MTPQEAGELLVLMQGSWPRLASDAVAARLWTEDLMRCDKACALEAFRMVRDFSDKTPSWSTFLESYRASVRRRGLERPALNEADYVPPTEADKERVRALVADLSVKLAAPGRSRRR